MSAPDAYQDLEAHSFFDILAEVDKHKDRITDLLVVANTPEGVLAAVGANPERAMKLLRFAVEYVAQSYNMPVNGVVAGLLNLKVREEIAAIANGMTPDVAEERLEEPTE